MMGFDKHRISASLLVGPSCGVRMSTPGHTPQAGPALLAFLDLSTFLDGHGGFAAFLFAHGGVP